MAAIHFEGHLPTGVQLIEDDIIGSTSGNPAGPVAYGLIDDQVPPRFATAFVLPGAYFSDPKEVIVSGPLKHDEYAAVMEFANHFGVNEFSVPEPHEDRLLARTNVPRSLNTEKIIGTLVELVFGH